MVHGYRNTVDGVVAAHSVARFTVRKSRFKDRQAVAEYIVPTHGAGGAVQSPHRVAVADVVLGFGSHGVRCRQVCPLHTQYGFACKLSTKVCVLTIGFFRATIPWITNQIHDGAVCFVNPASPGLCRNGVSHLAPEFRLKACRQTNLLRKTGCVVCHQPMQCFLAKKVWDAKTCVFYGIPLHNIGLGSSHTAQLHTADTIVLHQCIKPLHIHGCNLAVFVLRCKIAGIILICLQDLFFKGHPAHQVANALFCRKIRVLVWVHLFSPFMLQRAIFAHL